MVPSCLLTSSVLYLNSFQPSVLSCAILPQFYTSILKAWFPEAHIMLLMLNIPEEHGALSSWSRQSAMGLVIFRLLWLLRDMTVHHTYC